MRANRKTFPGVLLAITCLLGGITLGGEVTAEDSGPSIRSGHWQATETFENGSGNQEVKWSFEILDDGSATVHGIGSRYESNGKPLRDRSISILFFDRHEDGTFSGSYIESHGDGKQVELDLNVGLSPDQKEMQLETIAAAGEVVSRFEAIWIGPGLKADLKSGTWSVREIVAPGKGSWDIEWKFQINESDGRISGRGNKSLVNARKCYPGERKTYCSINLARDPGQPSVASGSAIETNHVGKKTRAAYRGWISPSGRTFFMLSYEKDQLAALLVGRYKGS